jgi:hypothetical protein
MFKNLLQLRSKLTTSSQPILKSTKKFFSQSQFGGPQPKASYASYALVGAGTAGIAYLMLYGRNLNSTYN